MSNKLQITSYMHCGKCLEELPEGVSAQEYRQYDIGWTEKGLQVWCVRHECNIVNVDFEGHIHPADTTALDKTLKLVKV